MEYKYMIQRRYQTELMKKVGGAMGKMFEYIEGDSLHANETITAITAPKPISKKKRAELCTGLLAEAKLDPSDTTLSFECVPYSESIEARVSP